MVCLNNSKESKTAVENAISIYGNMLIDCSAKGIGGFSFKTNQQILQAKIMENLSKYGQQKYSLVLGM